MADLYNWIHANCSVVQKHDAINAAGFAVRFS